MITIEKYLGKTIDLIYLDQNEKLTRRKIRPLSVKDGKVLAYCFLRHSRRIFQLENILSFLPVEKREKNNFPKDLCFLYNNKQNKKGGEEI